MAYLQSHAQIPFTIGLKTFFRFVYNYTLTKLRNAIRMNAHSVVKTFFRFVFF